MALALQRSSGNAAVQRLARSARPAARVLARTPTADQTRWRGIFDEQRRADPAVAHVRTLVQAFRDDHISGGSARERFRAILSLTGSSSEGPGVHFDEHTIRAIGTESSPTGTGDTGFRRELRDSVHYRRDEHGADMPMHRLSSDQIGHFLTAAHFGYALTERDNYIARQYREAAEYRSAHPYLSFLRDALDPTTDMAVQYAFEKEQYLRAMVGHELIADRALSGTGLSSTLGAPLAASSEDVQNFLTGRLDRIAVDDSRRGNSYQDLLLTWVGYRFGQHISNDVITSRQEAARWLELMLTETSLSAVAATDPFGRDARDMERMLQQFRDIQQRTHPAPQPVSLPR